MRAILKESLTEVVELQKVQGAHVRELGERVERLEASRADDYRRFEKRFKSLEESLEAWSRRAARATRR